MALFVPDESIRRFTEIVIGQKSFSNLTLKLFVNNLYPDAGTTVSNIVEANGSGYVSRPLEANEWQISVSKTRAIATYPRLSFIFNAPLGNVYGYYVVNAADELFWVERFSNAPIPIENNGDVIRIIPRLSLT